MAAVHGSGREMRCRCVCDQVKVIVHGKILNDTYMHILFDHPELGMETVYLLDQVQKGHGKELTAEALRFLRKNGLVEGKKPNIYLSARVSAETNAKAEYIRNRSFDDQYFRDMIINYLKQFGKATKVQFRKLLMDKLPDSLSDAQKESKIGNLLSTLRMQGKIIVIGHEGKQAIWALVEEE